MPDFDDILNKRLDDLERGATLEDVLRDLPGEAKDLAPLIRLAAAVRILPHPEPMASQVTAQRQQVMAAAIRNTQPIRRPQQAPVRQPSLWERLKQSFNGLNYTFALSAVGAMAVLMVLAIIGTNAWSSTNALNSARVDAIAGQVQVATDPTGTAWKNIEAGYRVRQGDRLRTLGASTATLAFFEGTRTVISANSDMTFTELRGNSDSTLQVKIDQAAGETHNQVTPFNGNTRSFFLVQTPSGTASVHGTNFNVRVSQNGLSTFAVTNGVVKVQNDGSNVTLNAGQATAADTTGDIATPAYQFSIQGTLTDKNDATQTWTVSELQFQVTNTTVLNGVPQLGDIVNVSGRILADQTRVADTVTMTGSTDETAYFTGTLEKISGDAWQISGSQVKVTSDTVIAGAPAVGDPVKVSFNLLEDGSYLATRIESLVERAGQTTPAPTATPDPKAAPEYKFAPEEVETKACGQNSFDISGSLRNTASDATDYAANVQLGYLIDQGGEYVSAVTITPNSFARIDAGQEAAFTVHVTANQKWSAAGEGAAGEDAAIKLRIFIASATNRPDRLNGRMTISIEPGCSATPTAVPGAVTQTATPEMTETASLTPTVEATSSAAQSEQCTGAEQQPTGLRLAQRYGVTYHEIIGWFCQGYGFGEIDLAYSLSREYNQPVANIFALRASGMGWGEIKKTLAKESAPAQSPKDNDNSQGEDNNNQGNGNGNGNGHKK